MNTFHNTEIVVVGVTWCFFREKRLCQNFTNHWVVCESTFTLLHSPRRVEQRKVSLLGWWRRETFLFSPPGGEEKHLFVFAARREDWVGKDQTRLNFYLTISISIRGVPLIEKPQTRLEYILKNVWAKQSDGFVFAIGDDANKEKKDIPTNKSCCRNGVVHHRWKEQIFNSNVCGKRCRRKR